MPGNKINFLIIVHCHQPVGNFDWVFKEAYDKSYLPFLEVLEKHPKIKVALHYSGCLLDWLKEKRPEFLDTLKRLVKNGQVEMVAGGYHEPILPLIPDRDKLGQLKMHTDFIKEHMGYDTNGVWLTERVWEPYLAKIFSQAGLRYTVVDDSHFELAGKKVDEILGYYLTEEEGFTLAIFPSSKKLRYNMPFRLPHETIDYLRSVATPDGTRAVTFGDDGEKFGLWPQTYKWVYEEKWLDNFFKAVEGNSDWINIIKPSEYLERYEPLGRLYLPCASYPEMLEWSGGYFRNFLVKYPEANWMHKRMLHVSEKLAFLDNKEKAPKLKEARDSLYRAQCNCAYWHGVFGGLYLHHLRTAVYKNIIDSEKSMRDQEKTKGPVKTEILDIDKDGADEIVLDNGPLGIYVDPLEGGAIIELDYRPKSLNIVNTLTRRPELYHKKITRMNNGSGQTQKTANGVASIHDLAVAKEKNLSEFLNYDWYQKSFMIEHFLPSNSKLLDFSRVNFKELGNFVAAPYRCDLKKEAGSATLFLEREGYVAQDDKPVALKLNKSLKIESRKPVLDVSYRLKNMSDETTSLWFGSEFNVSLMDPEFYKVGELLNVNRVDIEDEWFKVFLKYSLNKNCDLWFYPVETISESESGMEKTYQQLCLFFHWRFTLKPKQTWSVDMSLEIT
jgi:4-alpha-glucanotransferase